MAGRMKQLVRTAVALGATLLLGKAIRKAAQDRRVRQKAGELQQAVRNQVRSAGKTAGMKANQLAKAVGKQAPAIGREAAKQIKKLVDSAAG
jgi:ribosome-binding protein aMBF1 (putative translation factor)